MQQQHAPEEVQEAIQPDSWVVRFDRTARLVHWVQASTFLLLMATGLIIGISGLEAVVGHRALLRQIHLTAAFFFVFGPGLVALAGNWRSIARDARLVDEWSESDLQWLLHPSLIPNRDTPPPGRFNAGQKFNAIFTVYSTLAFAVTGLILWQNRRFPFSIVSQANTIHTYLAYIALVVFLGHLYLSAFHPATRASLHGILFGTVRHSWARRHHPGWQAPLSERALSPAGVVRSIILFALGGEAVLLVVRFGFEWLGANTTDPVTKLLYAVTALPATLGHPQTGIHLFDLAALVWTGLAVTFWLGFARRQPILPAGIRPDDYPA